MNSRVQTLSGKDAFRESREIKLNRAAKELFEIERSEFVQKTAIDAELLFTQGRATCDGFVV